MQGSQLCARESLTQHVSHKYLLVLGPKELECMEAAANEDGRENYTKSAWKQLPMKMGSTLH